MHRTLQIATVAIAIFAVVFMSNVLNVEGRARVISPAPTPTPNEINQQQMADLLREKETRTAAQQKIDSQLIYKMKELRHERIGPNTPSMPTSVKVDERCRTVVDITIKDLASVSASLRKLEGTEVIFPSSFSIRARVYLSQIEVIAGWPNVVFVNQAQQAYLNTIRAVTETDQQMPQDRRERKKLRTAGCF